MTERNKALNNKLQILESARSFISREFHHEAVFPKLVCQIQFLVFPPTKQENHWFFTDNLIYKTIVCVFIFVYIRVRYREKPFCILLKHVTCSQDNIAQIFQ